MKRALQKVISLVMLTLILVTPCTVVISATDVMTPELEVKLQEIVDECKEQVDETDEYAVALWFHDWLIYNANYDYTYTEYDTDGVVLKGTGTCQSYSYAFSELLDRMNIENMFIVSYEMNHMWNLVKLNGCWCHVDCTWDDPNEGGLENHSYFGLTDTLMGKDHTWIREDYPECSSKANYYPVHEGMNVVEDTTQLFDILSELCAQKKKTFEIYSISTAADFIMSYLFDLWFTDNYSRFGLSGYSMSYSGGMISLALSYFGVPDMGNINGDPEVDIKDATLFLKFLANWDVEVDISQADTNKDGEVDIKDITLLLKFLAGWDVIM